MKKIIIHIPASTTNIGPGFDCLGLALNLYNTIEIIPTPGEKIRFTVEGEGVQEIHHPKSNLVLEGFIALCQKTQQPAPEASFHLINRIPFARGLGSSAAAYLGGLTAANILLGKPFQQDEIISMAVDYEHHPDNVVPAMVGGFTIATITPTGTQYIKLNSAKIPLILAAIPDFPMKTKESRAVLPDQIPFRDAVHNIGRTALLISAITEGKWEYLREATQDRLHQDYRDTPDHFIAKAIAASLDGGAYGAALSGSGSTILAFIPLGNTSVAANLEKYFQERNISARILPLEVDQTGLRVELD